MKLHSERIALPIFPRRIVAAAVLALCTGQALAIDPFTVKDIRVEGIQRTEAGTVFSYLPVRVGDTFNDEKAAAAIKALYATGFFKDVRIEAEGDVLVVMVEERPAIANVEFSGVKEFEKDKLVKSLKEIGVGESRILDKSLLDRAEQELKRQYLSRGLYGVQITTTVTPIERNRVTITFAVDEGEVARIRGIKFIGNKAYSDGRLRDEMKLDTPGWFSWYTKADQYSRQKLTGDIEALRSLYLNNGYLEVQIQSTQVSISPDKKDIYITINITEGDKFTVSDIKLEGQMFGREEELKSLVSLGKGDVYSGEKLQDSMKKISDRMGNFGYAFANINAAPDINREKKEVAFTLLVDPGRRVYVRNVNIAGNTRTRDEVIRRELRQFENSWYDASKIKTSRERVDRLDYFTDVAVDSPEVPGTTDQVDVNFTVTEKPTGSLTVGAGFSSSEKLVLSGGVRQDNVFGSGQSVSIDINTSKINRTIAVSQTNPYFTDDGVSRSYDLYYRTTTPPISSTGDYNIKSLGASVRFGVPFSEVDTVFFGAGVERTRVETYNTNDPNHPNSPRLYQTYVANLGATGPNPAATATSFPLTAAWQRDSRDSAMTPMNGRYQRAYLEVAPVGTLKYYRATYQHQYFMPLFLSGITLALNGEVNYGKGMGGKAYPVFKNFYAGGIGSVRGYETSTVGPRDETLANRDPLGGTSRLIGNVELQFPFPGTGNDRSLRWFTFLDAGNVYAEGVRPSFSDLRYSTGLGITWISPVGPLKLSFGKALSPKAGDSLQRFQFQIGTGF